MTITPFETMARLTCGGILLSQGRILLGKRRSDRLYPDIWDIFGGHIEEGETKEDTLKRELEEEIGIIVRDFEFIEIYQDQDPTYGIDYIHHIYLVRSWDGTPENRVPREHEEIRWFTKEETMGLPMHGEVRRIILEHVDF
jgi:mutator protein MutT